MAGSMMALGLLVGFIMGAAMTIALLLFLNKAVSKSVGTKDQQKNTVVDAPENRLDQQQQWENLLNYTGKPQPKGEKADD